MKTIKNLAANELRKSILQLAIQGKLVKQDPNDEPASELVKKIYKEKKKLIAERKIKKDKNESHIFKGDDNCYYEKISNKDPVKLDDLPFDIPDNWTWVRFQNLVNFVLGKTPDRHNSKYWNDGIYNWLAISDMKDKETVYTTKEKISEYSFKENFASTLSPAGTLLMSFKLTIGRVSILGIDAIHNEGIISIFPYLDKNFCVRNWLFYVLGILVTYVEQTDAIKGNTLNKNKMSSMLIPLPPLNEQQRIVKKINSFEPLLQEYEKLEKKLTQLELTFSEELKKSILQLAIQGKLVKQDPNNEPASELVKKIYEEKRKLVADGKIKKDKNESYIFKGDDKNYYEKIGNNEPVKLDDLPFDIPDNWTWIRQKNVCWLDNGVKSKGEMLPYLEAKVIRGLKEPEIHKSGIIVDSTFRVILVDGENSGEIMIPPFKGYMGSTFKIFSAIRLFNYDFLLNIFSLNKEMYKNTKIGAAIPHLNKQLFKESLIALPPLKEQNRIVNKINTLFDFLKAS